MRILPFHTEMHKEPAELNKHILACSFAGQVIEPEMIIRFFFVAYKYSRRLLSKNKIIFKMPVFSTGLGP